MLQAEASVTPTPTPTPGSTLGGELAGLFGGSFLEYFILAAVVLVAVAGVCCCCYCFRSKIAQCLQPGKEGNISPSRPQLALTYPPALLSGAVARRDPDDDWRGRLYPATRPGFRFG